MCYYLGETNTSHRNTQFDFISKCLYTYLTCNWPSIVKDWAMREVTFSVFGSQYIFISMVYLYKFFLWFLFPFDSSQYLSREAYKCRLKEFHEVHEIIKINWISNWIEAYLKLPTLNKQYNISFESSLGDKEVQFINHYACLLYYKTSRNMKFKIDASTPSFKRFIRRYWIFLLLILFPYWISI